MALNAVSVTVPTTLSVLVYRLRRCRRPFESGSTFWLVQVVGRPAQTETSMPGRGSSRCRCAPAHCCRRRCCRRRHRWPSPPPPPPPRRPRRPRSRPRRRSPLHLLRRARRRGRCRSRSGRGHPGRHPNPAGTSAAPAGTSRSPANAGPPTLPLAAAGPGDDRGRVLRRAAVREGAVGDVDVVLQGLQAPLRLGGGRRRRLLPPPSWPPRTTAGSPPCGSGRSRVRRHRRARCAPPGAGTSPRRRTRLRHARWRGSRGRRTRRGQGDDEDGKTHRGTRMDLRGMRP